MVAATATGPHHHFSVSLHLAVQSSGWLDGLRVGGCGRTTGAVTTVVLETAGDRLHHPRTRAATTRRRKLNTN